MGRTHCKVSFLDGFGNPTKRKLRKKKIRIATTLIILISLALVAVFYTNPSLIGLVVQEKTQQHVEQLNLQFSEPGIYEWQVENPGELTSLKISGELIGQGEVQVYLEDYLVYDSTNTQQTGLLTGLAIEESSEPAVESAPEPVPEPTSSETTTEESTSYSEEEVPEQEVSPSQQEPLISSEPNEGSIGEGTITEPAEPEEIIEEPVGEPVEENLTEAPEPVEEPIEEIPENLTEQNVTEPTSPATEIKERRKFNDVCEETCSLPNLEQDTYAIRIEINNATLSLDKIKYEILTREISFIDETNQTQTNITEINETIIEEVNITDTTLFTPKIKVGEPVKWIKQVKLEEPGSIKVKLPKEAKNISVNKIRELYSDEQEESPSQEIPPASENQTNLTQILNESYSDDLEEVPQNLSPSQNDSVSLSQKEEPLPSENLSSEEQEESPSQEIPPAPISEQSEEPAAFSITSGITGQVIEEQEKTGFFTRLFASLTGNVVRTEETIEDIEVIIKDNASEYEIIYETPAPQAFETQINEKKKQIVISGPDNLNYTDILAYTTLPEEAKSNLVKIYHIINETRIPVEIQKYDTNNNSLIDYIEWIVPHLSNQTYELIIKITKAEHLNENYTLVEDVYELVKSQDYIYTRIPDQHVLRITFEAPLTKERDITIYAKVNGTAKIEVYKENTTELVTTFENVTEEGWYKVYLTNLTENESYDVFDLMSLGDVEYDYVVDPIDTLSGNGAFDTAGHYAAWEDSGVNDNDGEFVHETTTTKAGAGSLKGQNPNKGKQWTGEYKNISTASINANLESTLNFSWRKEYVTAIPTTALMNIVLIKPDLSETELWTNSETTWDTWTDVSLNITGNITQTGGYQLRLDCNLINPNTNGAESYCFFDEVYLYIEDTIAPTTQLNSPSDYANVTATVNFNCTSTDSEDGLKNITLYGNWSGSWHANETVTVTGANNESNFTKTLTQGTYYWNCFSCDQADNCEFNETNFTLTVDTTKPQIYLEYPANNTLNNTDNTPEFKFNVSDNINAELSCQLWIQNSSNDLVPHGTNTTVLNSTTTTINANESLTNGDFWWWINCTDNAGNENKSEVRNSSINTDQIPPNVTLDSPENDSLQMAIPVELNCTSYDDEKLLNTTLYFSGTGGGSEEINLEQHINNTQDGLSTFYGITCTLPTPATEGNLLVMGVGVNKDAGTFTLPSGFTEIHNTTATSVSGGMAYKIAEGGETSVTWNWTAGEPASCWLGEFSGIRTDNPLDVYAFNTTFSDADSTTDRTSSGVTGTTSQNSELAIAMFTIDTVWNADAGRDWTNGFTDLGFPEGTSDEGQAGIGTAYKILASAGAIETVVNWTGTSGSADQAYAMIATFKGSGTAWHANETATITGTQNTTNFTKILTDNQTYYWNCYACDQTGNCNFSSENSTFILNTSSSATPNQPTLNNPQNGSTEVSENPVLNVTVTDPEGEVMDVYFYGRTKTTAENWTIIMLPDTQNYASTYPEIFENQTQWIKDNKDGLNIKIVLGVGDIVDTWDNTIQWDVANASYDYLFDNNVPFNGLLGDHDHYDQDPEGSTSYHYLYFDETRFNSSSWWGGDYNNNTNNYLLLMK